MNIQSNVLLAPYTSFQVGGKAEHFALVEDYNALTEALKCTLESTQLWLLGYGSNSLISDHGLSGMVLCIRGGSVELHNSTTIVADAGAWWDDVVTTSIAHDLWGIELLSEVPGSVGAALYINIAAYGQSISERVAWIDVWDRKLSLEKRLYAEELAWGYKTSIFQDQKNSHLVILRAGFTLSTKKTADLTYQKAVDIATVKKLDANDLHARRQIIIEARKLAGSLWSPAQQKNHTVGSFFRNPIVSHEQADYILSQDESGKTVEQLKKMNQVHGGNEQRVSAAHVMLAAGFKRGQQWNNVKLNEQNLLKIEALDGASAQDIYDVAMHIQQTCLEKIGIVLEPEARILGEFTQKTR